MLWFVGRLDGGEVECDGELIQTNAVGLLDAEPDQRRQALVFDDGSAVDLFLESWVNVIDTCVEGMGRWKGVAGTFEGRSGTFRGTDDLVQIEIVLTDSAPVATVAPTTTIAPAATVASDRISTAVVSEADTAAESAFEPVAAATSRSVQ